MKKHLLFLSALLTACIFASFTTNKIVKKGNCSIIAISATSSGLGAKGFGIEITLRNVNTNESFKSESLSPFSPHSIIKNIPPGIYIVDRIKVPVGNITYANWSDSTKLFFRQINIKPNSKYYLGNFIGTREIGKRNVLHLRLANELIPEKIRNKIENIKTGWKEGEFIKLYPYDKEELLVY